MALRSWGMWNGRPGDGAKLEMVDGGEVMSRLDAFGRRAEFGLNDTVVIGGEMYARTPEAAEAMGWGRLADFMKAVALHTRRLKG